MLILLLDIIFTVNAINRAHAHETNFLYWALFENITKPSGRSRISQMQEGHQPQGGGTNLLFGQFFPKKLH